MSVIRLTTRIISVWRGQVYREYALKWRAARKGGRYRKSAKIDALRECKEEILEAHRSGISIHRIAQILRERNVDISTQDLMRAIRLFIKKGRDKS